MVIKSVELETVCGVTSVLPENTLFEVAFAGKSNVGKSSMINTILNRKGMARISSQPGKTQTINFYNINNIGYLVDLPGYGYARANEEIKAQWGVMIENYLHQSAKLQAVFLLIDIRHEPGANDRMMYDYIIRSGLPFMVLCNKADKIAVTKVENAVKAIQSDLNPIGDFTFMPFSAERKIYSEDVWNILEDYI